MKQGQVKCVSSTVASRQAQLRLTSDNVRIWREILKSKKKSLQAILSCLFLSNLQILSQSLRQRPVHRPRRYCLITICAHWQQLERVDSDLVSISMKRLMLNFFFWNLWLESRFYEAVPKVSVMLGYVIPRVWRVRKENIKLGYPCLLNHKIK